MFSKKSSKVVAIIQARLTSTRLPHKIEKVIGDKTVLEHVVERVKRANHVDKVVLAVPHVIPTKADVPQFVGDEKDVLHRYYKCALKYKADVIVRITADCPLIDPEVITLAVVYYLSSPFPYVCFAPIDGLDVEVFSFKLLKKAWTEAKDQYDREHVTPYMRRITKLSVDTQHDLERVRKFYGLQGQSDTSDRRDGELREFFYKAVP